MGLIMKKIIWVILLIAVLSGCERHSAEYEYRVIGSGKMNVEYKTHTGEMASHRIMMPWTYSGRIDQTAHLFLKVPSWEPRVELHVGEDLVIQSTFMPDSVQLINIVVAVQERWY